MTASELRLIPPTVTENTENRDSRVLTQDRPRHHARENKVEEAPASAERLCISCCRCGPRRQNLQKKGSVIGASPQTACAPSGSPACKRLFSILSCDRKTFSACSLSVLGAKLLYSHSLICGMKKAPKVKSCYKKRNKKQTKAVSFFSSLS